MLVGVGDEAVGALFMIRGGRLAHLLQFMLIIETPFFVATFQHLAQRTLQ